ncbi:pyridoxal phosphate-dependent aminotransferase [Clostridium fallax]|uniref:Aminotransferase n=1 Tax=Clostridium fallax TaxID=1533 RepID=A0A1M4V4C2_9CLOT|nr:pyridoxal phosphate-dependent aminotransferase [Clostridium fallax]SHE63836.1 aspartate aminotransferase [Clostridium fallax]SQB06553.1 aspartate aminotransferase [Clostridium fallax]
MKSNRVKDISASKTLEITKIANEMKSLGKEVINFAAGEPDFFTPKNIQDAAIKAIREGKTKYTATSGLSDLKKEIIKKLKYDNNIEYKEEQILVSTGAKQCLANIFLSILNDSDEVILLSPYWTSYPELIKIAGGKSVFLTGNHKNNYKINKLDLEKIITDKTKAIIINSPSNPTGVIYDKKELEEIAEVCKKYNLIIISDEIYEKLSYDRKKHISIASLSEDSYKRTLVVNGFSKAYAMTGWRLGYVAGDREVISYMTKLQSHTTSNPNTISQYAAIEALKGSQKELENMVIEFESRRNLTVNILNNIKEVSYIKPEGAFYVMIDVSKLYNTYINNYYINNSDSFCKFFLEEENVAVIPGSAFGADNYIRISFATSRENITKGLEKLQNFINKLKF